MNIKKWQQSQIFVKHLWSPSLSEVYKQIEILYFYLNFFFSLRLLEAVLHSLYFYIKHTHTDI